MSGYIDIGALEDIRPRAARLVKTPLGCVAVFRTADDRVFALDDMCPHKGGPLSQGIQHGTSVTCPLHNWVIDLNSGEAQGEDQGRVRIYSVRVEKGRILLDRESLVADMAAE
ncbi:MAG: nitrite reductase small subunit NirD [Pseudomonadota bacterium]